MNIKVNNEKLANVLSIASVVAAGLVAVVNAIGEQKQAKEFEALKAAVAELQNK